MSLPGVRALALLAGVLSLLVAFSSAPVSTKKRLLVIRGDRDLLPHLPTGDDGTRLICTSAPQHYITLEEKLGLSVAQNGELPDKVGVTLEQAHRDAKEVGSAGFYLDVEAKTIRRWRGWSWLPINDTVFVNFQQQEQTKLLHCFNTSEHPSIQCQLDTNQLQLSDLQQSSYTAELRDDPKFPRLKYLVAMESNNAVARVTYSHGQIRIDAMELNGQRVHGRTEDDGNELAADALYTMVYGIYHKSEDEPQEKKSTLERFLIHSLVHELYVKNKEEKPTYHGFFIVDKRLAELFQEHGIQLYPGPCGYFVNAKNFAGELKGDEPEW